MFRFSLSTVLMTVVASNALLLVITLLLRKSRLLVRVGYNLLIVFVVFVVLRCLFPVEFIPAKDIYLENYFSRLVSFLRRRRQVSFVPFSFRIWHIVELVWAVGFVIALVIHLREKKKLAHHINRYGKIARNKEPYASILKKISDHHRKSPDFRVFEMELLPTPMICGGFKPCILIPKELELPKEDLYYVLCHETAHYYHRDFLISEFIEIIMSVYWWLKFIAPDLRKQVEAVLEMRVDDSVTAAGEEELNNYLNCLERVSEKAKALKESGKLKPMRGGISLLDEDNEEIFRIRKDLIQAGKDKQNPALKWLLTVFAAAVFVASYCVTFETVYVRQEYVELVEETSITFEFYAIEKNNHTYDIYVGNSFYMETVNTLKNYPKDIPVYKSEEEREQALQAK